MPLRCTRNTLFAVAIVFGATACLPDRPAEGVPDYRTVVSHAEDDGLPAYWLGASFDAGGLSFADIDASYPNGYAGELIRSLELDYLAIEDVSDVNHIVWASLEVHTILKGDYERIEPELRSMRANPRASSASVTVGGVEAELFALPFATRPINVRVLVVEFDDALVIARTHSGIAEGRETNPLITDESLFLAVMEQLRPYPE